MSALCQLLTALAVSSTPAVDAVADPVIAQQQVGRAVCRLRLDAGEVALSGAVRLTLSVEGPSPVEVEVPPQLTLSPDWRIKASPARTTDLPGGRQRWEQSFRVEPFRAGAVPLPLSPLSFRTGNEVRDWPLEWQPQTVRVKSSVSKADLESARPPADIERLAPAERRSYFWWYVGGGVGLGMAAGAAAVWLLRGNRGKQLAAQTPRARALAEFDRLGRDGGPRPEQLPLIADVLRRFLEDHFRLAATRQTTAEFHITLLRAGALPNPEIERVMEVLARCDLTKFAGARFDAETCQRLLRLAREAVAEAGGAGQGETPA